MKILVVEDEHRIAQAIREGLEEEGFAVDVEFDGEDGYNAATTLDYDLVIMDVMMPVLTGFQVTEKLRSNGSKVPILLLTAKDQPKDVVNGLNLGADDYLAKPFSFDVLLARVNALLRRPRHEYADKLTVADLVLDPVGKTVQRAGQHISLSAREFSLLEYLMRNPGRILSKNNIMNHVWEFDADILPNNIEVFITFLRKKVDKPFDRPLIHTVRGFGYKISEDK